MFTESNIDKSTWKDFIKKNGPVSGRFLHSYEWGDFQEATGASVKRLVVNEDGEMKAAFQVVHKSVSLFGSYSYCPRGPVFKEGFEFDVKEIKEMFSGDFFFRFEKTKADLLKGSKKVSEIQPTHTLISDLTVTEEDLLKGMHEKTRYNIRLARKKGVRVNVNDVSFEDVWNLFEQTSSRGEFRLHNKDYYKKMLAVLDKKECKAFLATAWHEEDLLAANIMIDFDGTRTYLHGASSNTKRNMMAPYLLQFELMRSAKKDGLKFYDWWGVAPIGADKSHSWSGISRFKRGFGGTEVGYLGTHDLVLSPLKYYAYRFVKMIRR